MLVMAPQKKHVTLKGVTKESLYNHRTLKTWLQLHEINKEQ